MSDVDAKSGCGVKRWRGRWLPGPAWIGPDAIQQLFATQRHLDAFGHRVHTAAAVITCFLAGWPTTFIEWSPSLLLIVFAVRMTEHHRVLRPLWADRVIWLLLAWIGWSLISVAWTAGSRQDWLEEVSVVRFAFLPLLLYPVLDRREWLVCGLAAGVLCGNATQVVQVLDGAGIWPSSPWARLPGRVSGWWDPVVGGSVLCAALGLHIGAAALGRTTRERAWGGLLSGVTLAAIAATGTRGAWIAAMIVVLVGAVLLVRRWARSRTACAVGLPADRTVTPSLRRIVIGGALVAVLLLLAAVALEPLSSRARQGYEEVRLTLTNARYDTDTGTRIGMWEWAGAAMACKPVRGVGVGGYRPWVLAEMDSLRRDEPRRCEWRGPTTAKGFTPHAHAHSWWLHTTATLGLVGLGLLGALVALGIRSGLREGSAWSKPGPALGLVGLAAAGLFDTIAVNQQTACWWILLTTLCLPTRPRSAAE